MLIYVNREPVAGPWGGGSKVLAAIIDGLRRAGYDVVHTLSSDVDVVLCVDPRIGPKPNLLGYGSIRLNICQSRKQGVKAPRLVQRVGDLGTHGKPDLMHLVLGSVLQADTVIFPSRWARDSIEHCLRVQDLRFKVPPHVISNAPDGAFYANRRSASSLPDMVSLVSHHWSTNDKKGFSFYQQLLDCSHLWTFTYIGREPYPGWPKQSGLAECTPGVLGVMSTQQLVEELPKHHVYVTASVEEAGANHVLEAMACGLPVIYHQDGGSIGEYVGPCGVPFDGTMPSFMAALRQVRATYPKLHQALDEFAADRCDLSKMAEEYVRVIEGVCA